MGQEREKRMWVGSGPLPCGAHSWPSPGAPVDPGSCSYFSTDSLSVVLTIHGLGGLVYPSWECRVLLSLPQSLVLGCCGLH